jgi:hypothetical protein
MAFPRMVSFKAKRGRRFKSRRLERERLQVKSPVKLAVAKNKVTGMLPSPDRKSSDLHKDSQHTL